MLYIFAVIFFSILLLWHRIGKKNLEKLFDRNYENWGLLKEQKNKFLKINNLQMNFMLIPLFILSLVGAIIKIDIFSFLVFTCILLIPATIISQFEPAILDYRWYNTRKNIPFRIWNYLAFKGEKKLKYELWWFYLPNPTTPYEQNKVIDEIKSLSQEQRQHIINSLESSKFKTVSHRANKTVVNWSFKLLNWVWKGVSFYSIYTWFKNTYFDGCDKALINYVISNVDKYWWAIALSIFFYKLLISTIDICTTQNRKRFAQTELFKQFNIPEDK